MRKRNNRIFKVHIRDFGLWNPSLKSKHKLFMIPSNLLTDPRVRGLPATSFRLYCGLLATCGDFASEVITVSEPQVNDLLANYEGATSGLSRLQSLRLLTFEEIDFLGIELNRTEEKRTESEVQLPLEAEPPPAPPDSELPPPAEHPPEGQWLVDLWNTYRIWAGSLDGEFPKVVKVSADARRKILKRIEAYPEQETWVQIFENARRSKFLREEFPGFDFWWLMKNDDNPRKVLQGNYRDKGAPTPKALEGSGQGLDAKAASLWSEFESKFKTQGAGDGQEHDE